MNRDVTFCSSPDCPSTECRLKLSNYNFKPHTIISVADFSGVCRFYIGCVLADIIESEKNNEHTD